MEGDDVTYFDIPLEEVGEATWNLTQDSR